VYEGYVVVTVFLIALVTTKYSNITWQ